MTLKNTMGLLPFGLIALLLLASIGVSGCATKEVQIVRTSLKPPSKFGSDHHVIVAQQDVMVTVGDEVVEKYDAGGQYIIHPVDWDTIMEELNSLNAEIDKLLERNKSPPE